MTKTATGTFDVDLGSLDPNEPNGESTAIERHSIEKVFHGDLKATSRGEMLSVHTTIKGSAAYVALEEVTGNLEGVSGSFALVHLGTMQGDSSRLILEVVPDSGTGDLAGLVGTMAINRNDDGHHYVFEYSVETATET